MPCTHWNPALAPLSHGRRSSSFARLQTPLPAAAFVVCCLLDGNSMKEGLHPTIYCLFSPGQRSDCLIKKPPSYSGEGMLWYQGEQAWRNSITLWLRFWHQDIHLSCVFLGHLWASVFSCVKGRKWAFVLDPLKGFSKTTY